MKTVKLTEWQVACLQEVVEKSDKAEIYDKLSYNALVKILSNAKEIRVKVLA